MKKTILFLFLSVSLTSLSQTVNIPDANFKNALLNQSPVIDTNGDGEIQITEAEATTDVVVFDSNVSDLTGLEAFINLEFLQASFNNIDAIDTSFFPNLEILSISFNALQNLDLSQNLNLDTAITGDNPITEIDLTNNLNLRVLSLSNTSLETVNIQNNTLLEVVRVDGSALNTLDVSDLSLLNTLEISNTNLATIDLSQNTNLLALQANTLAFTSLDISNNTQLQILDITSTNITSLDLTNNSNLRLLEMADTLFTTFDPSVLPALQYIDFSLTPITHINFSENPSLCFVFAISDELETVNLQNGNNTVFGSGQDCIVSAGFTTFSASAEVFLAGNNLSSICVDDIAYAEENFLITDDVTYFEDCLLSIDDSSLSDISLYPNPTNGILNLDTTTPIQQINIYNTFGQLVREIQNDQGIRQVDLSTYDSGLYFIEVTAAQGKNSFRVIKE